jgi:hypothetical protein
MPRLSGRSSRGFGASGSFPGGLGSAVAILEYAAQERIVAQYLYEHAGVPTDGTNGTYAHVALPGALLIDTDAKTLYQNTGTQASPTWTERSAPSGGGSGVQITDPPIAISSAELLALHTTRKVLVAAQGAGKVIVPLQFVQAFTFGGVAYTTGGGNALEIGWPDGVDGLAIATLDINRLTLINNGLFVDLVAAGNYGNHADFANQPLGLKLDGPLAAGNGTTLLVVSYVVLTV